MTNRTSMIIALTLVSAMGSGYGAEKVSAKAGEALFKANCVVCHGEAGDGKGLASSGLNPKPRDFTKDDFKHKSTPKGTPPTDEDVLNTIKKGVKGTGMPPWDGALNAAQIKDVVAYIKTFNPEYWASRSGSKTKINADTKPKADK